MSYKAGIEYISVYINFKDGKTVCICTCDNKRCTRDCITDIVERDKYRGWQDIFKVNKYGKNGK